MLDSKKYKFICGKLKKLKILNQDLPIFGSVLLKKNSISCRTLEVEINFTAYLPEIKDSVLIYASDFLKFEKVIGKDDTLDFSFDGSQDAPIKVFKNGISKFKIGPHIASIEELPDSRIENNESLYRTMELHPKDLMKMINATKFCTNDQLRPAMTGIHVSDKIASTNGSVLVYEKMETPYLLDHFDQTESIIIKKEHILLLDKNEGYLLIVAGDNDSKNVIFECPDYAIAFRLIDERYPNYVDVVPESYNHKIIVDSKELLDKINEASTSWNKVTSQMVFNLNREEVILSSQDLDVNCEYKDTLETIGNKVIYNTLIGMNGSLLKELVSYINLEENELTMKFDRASRAIIINDRSLIMPIMLGDDHKENVPECVLLYENIIYYLKKETKSESDLEIIKKQTEKAEIIGLKMLDAENPVFDHEYMKEFILNQENKKPEEVVQEAVSHLVSEYPLTEGECYPEINQCENHPEKEVVVVDEVEEPEMEAEQEILVHEVESENELGSTSVMDYSKYLEEEENASIF